MMTGKAVRLGEDSGTSAIRARSVLRQLSPTHFVTAIGVGVVGVVFQALTYSVIPIGSLQLLVDYATLFAAMAACGALDRAGNRVGAWATLAIAYALVVFTCMQQSPDRELVIGQIMGHCMVLAVFVADRAVSSRASGRLAYVVAALAGIAAGALIWGAVLQFRPGFVTVDENWEAEAASPLFALLHPVYVAMFWLVFAGAAVIFHGERRLAEATLQRLRDTELERVRRSREMVESQLRATQARVEPQFLFSTLAHVRRSYRENPSFAGRMLDELVSFLRAAMPRMRDTSSTLGQEVELVRAYLGILRMNVGKRLDFVIEVSSHAARARLPAMLFLPLIDDVVMRGLRSGFGEATLRIAAAVQDEWLSIRVSNDTFGAIGEVADAGTIAVLRERLAALYGEDGTLCVLMTSGGGVEAVLEIPYESAAS